MAFKMKGSPMARNYGAPFEKNTGKPDVKNVLSYLENDGKAQTSEEAGVAVGVAKEQGDNIAKGGANYRHGATASEKAQEAAIKAEAKKKGGSGSALGNMKNK